MPLAFPARPTWALGPLLAAATAFAQTNPPPAPPPAPAPSPVPAAPAAAPAAPATGERVEITGGRDSDTQQRRQSTAAKIVIGREEIDKFGDATVGEVLRRLPGVTTPGAPGRGGPPRLRGLGGGFTQLLIDGQRIPPGFSLESLTPEQVERIEILRAPTAETGARAIAGTINIITREGFRRRLNDLRLGFGIENGRFSPGINWSHNDNAGNLTYTVSASAFRNRREDENRTDTTVEDLTDGTLLDDRSATSTTRGERQGMNLTTRLQWRLDATGDMLMLMPSVFHAENHSDVAFALDRRVNSGRPPVYDQGTSVVDSRFTTGRLGLQYRQRVGEWRLESNGSAGAWRARNSTLREEYAASSTQPLRVLDDRGTTRERSANLTFKGSRLLGGEGREHSLVSGAEVETVRRDEARVSLEDGESTTVGFGDNLSASVLRLAGYVQDEWSLSPQWALHAGLRWEGITTQGDDAQGERPRNRSSVWTPLVHAVWKPDPRSRDQVRVSLTRSYRSPGIASLIARPSINRDVPANQQNSSTTPDSVGNPNLKPELATGLDVAIERYLEGGGVLSASVFHRRIGNLIRGVTTLETVDWSNTQRWVRRPQNIGDATTQGVELEAKFRLDQLVAAAPRVEMRSNLSLYRSRVDGVPGPDNRLEQQAKASANLGADYRLRGTPLTLGGNLNWVPGYTTRTEAGRTVTEGRKQVWDAYALWTFNPGVALRLLGNNLDPRDHGTTTVVDTPVASTVERTTVASNGPSFTNWQLRLELKL
ncbi:MAG: TonB-dependent receptor [Rubrivivax sp.]|nr:TonB-dependent receptor [Rubrivivax sp.]